LFVSAGYELIWDAEGARDHVGTPVQRREVAVRALLAHRAALACLELTDERALADDVITRMTSWALGALVDAWKPTVVTRGAWVNCRRSDCSVRFKLVITFRSD